MPKLRIDARLLHSKSAVPKSGILVPKLSTGKISSCSHTLCIHTLETYVRLYRIRIRRGALGASLIDGRRRHRRAGSQRRVAPSKSSRTEPTRDPRRSPVLEAVPKSGIAVLKYRIYPCAKVWHRFLTLFGTRRYGQEVVRTRCSPTMVVNTMMSSRVLEYSRVLSYSARFEELLSLI